jgi:hypothetical protein
MTSSRSEAGPTVAMILVCRTMGIGYNREVTIKVWLENAIQDAERRNLPGLRPMLETFARSTSALRSADWNSDATGEPVRTPTQDAR